jgi:hypothetical protein
MSIENGGIETTAVVGDVAPEVTQEVANGINPVPETKVEVAPAKKGIDAILEKAEKLTKANKVAPTPATPDKPSYQANYKFKVLDKELEVDDFLKGVIKDSETEKKVKELYEKAYGLDSVKADRQTLKTQLAEVQDKYTKTEQGLDTLGKYVQAGDFDSFFDSLNIPKANILKYALDLVQREQWTPEQKASWQQGREAQQQAQYYQTQNQQLLQQQQQLSIQQREFDLSMVMSKPDISSVVQAYDAGMGNPGAFRELVIKFGQAYAAQGQDIPAEQAVQEAVKYLKAANPNLGMTAQAPVQQSNVVAPSNKPVIPNMPGKGTSPVRTTVKSIADIKKRAAELEAQGL